MPRAVFLAVSALFERSAENLAEAVRNDAALAFQSASVIEIHSKTYGN